MYNNLFTICISTQVIAQKSLNSITRNNLLWYNIINESNASATMYITIHSTKAVISNNSVGETSIQNNYYPVAWPCNNNARSVSHIVGIIVCQLLQKESINNGNL